MNAERRQQTDEPFDAVQEIPNADGKMRRRRFETVSSEIIFNQADKPLKTLIFYACSPVNYTGQFKYRRIIKSRKARAFRIIFETFAHPLISLDIR